MNIWGYAMMAEYRRQELIRQAERSRKFWQFRQASLLEMQHWVINLAVLILTIAFFWSLGWPISHVIESGPAARDMIKTSFVVSLGLFLPLRQVSA